jgi:hypothetical protein
MHASRWLFLAGAAATALAVGACSSSTAPAPITPGQLAKDFDAIYSSDASSGADSVQEAGGLIAEFIELAPTFGGTEATFQMTTGSGTQTWHGVGYGVAETGDCMSGDSSYVFALYPNRNLQQVVVVLLTMSGGTAVDEEVLASVDQLQSGGDDSVATGLASVVTSSGTCTEQTGLNADTLYSSFVDNAPCVPGTFTVSGSASFFAAANLGALSSVSFSNVTFHGPFFTAVDGPSRVVGIPSKGSALAQRVAAFVKQRRQQHSH